MRRKYPNGRTEKKTPHYPIPNTIINMYSYYTGKTRKTGILIQLLLISFFRFYITYLNGFIVDLNRKIKYTNISWNNVSRVKNSKKKKNSFRQHELSCEMFNLFVELLDLVFTWFGCWLYKAHKYYLCSAHFGLK